MICDSVSDGNDYNIKIRGLPRKKTEDNRFRCLVADYDPGIDALRTPPKTHVNFTQNDGTFLKRQSDWLPITIQECMITVDTGLEEWPASWGNTKAADGNADTNLSITKLLIYAICIHKCCFLAELFGGGSCTLSELGGTTVNIQDTGFRFAAGFAMDCVGTSATGSHFITEYMSSVVCRGTCGYPRLYATADQQQITNIPLLMEHI